MFRYIRQLVQKLNKDIKVETQHPSSHNNGKPFVARSFFCQTKRLINFWTKKSSKSNRYNFFSTNSYKAISPATIPITQLNISSHDLLGGLVGLMLVVFCLAKLLSWLNDRSD